MNFFKCLIKGPPHTLEKFCIQAHSSKLLKYMNFYHVLELKMTRKNSIGWGVNFLKFTAIHENKSPCGIRTRDLRVGRSKLQPLRHRDRHQRLAIKLFHNALKSLCCDVLL